MVVWQPVLRSGHRRRPELDAVAFAADPRDPVHRRISRATSDASMSGVRDTSRPEGSESRSAAHSRSGGGRSRARGLRRGDKAVVLAVGGEESPGPGRLVAYEWSGVRCRDARSSVPPGEPLPSIRRPMDGVRILDALRHPRAGSRSRALARNSAAARGGRAARD